MQSETLACFGFCGDCGVNHSLPEGGARSHAEALMREFREIGRLDYRVSEREADPSLSLEQMFPGGHGNMFGVLVCEDADGEPVVLRAFSSLLRGVREIDGWVPPLLSAETYYGMILPTQRRIEHLTADLSRVPSGSVAARDLVAHRKRISRVLLSDMQDLYRFRNFRGETRALRLAHWPRRERLVGGIGECCAPKLLDHAARRGLEPRGLAEFYWGDSDTKEPGAFYPCCAARCQPILGFLLCGADS